MTRFTTLAAAISMLVLPAASAFAAGEGTFQPTVAAWSASGPAIDRGIGASFVYSAGEGGQDLAGPVAAAPTGPRAPAVAAGSFQYNAGSHAG